MICSACPSFHSFKVAEVVFGASELELAQKNLEGDGYLQVERKFIHLIWNGLFPRISFLLEKLLFKEVHCLGMYRLEVSWYV